MNAVFLKILNMSLTAGLLILAVLPIRLMMKKAPKWTSCLLWLIVAVALVAPVRFESKTSVLPVTDPIPMTIVTEEVTSVVPETSDVVIEPSEDTVVQSELMVKPTNSFKALEIGTIVWCAGMAVLLGYAMASYLRLKRRVTVSIDMGENVYLCDEIDTPFILGIIRPCIYLPSALDEVTAAQVLVHERAHLARKDHWWKPLGYLLLTLHWFNPLVWVAYTLLCTDIELACDEKVIKDMDIGGKKVYSEALLNCSMPRHMIAACPLAFGEVSVKQRVKAVLHYKKPAFWVVLVAIAICVVLCLCFLTKPTIKDESPIQYEDLNRYMNQSRNNILSGELQETRNYGAFETQDILTFEDYKEICELLSSLELKSTPIAYDGSIRFAEKVISLTTADMGIIDFCFNRIFTEFWVLSSGNHSAVYEVRNPEILRAYFNLFNTVNYMEPKRIEMMFKETELGQSVESFLVMQPTSRYFDSHYAVLMENDENVASVYLVEYEIEEGGNYQLLHTTKGTTDAGNGNYHLNITLSEQTVLWGLIPYEKKYSDVDVIIETTDMTYTVPLYGPAFVAYLPQNTEILGVTCSNGKPVSLYFNSNGFDIPKDNYLTVEQGSDIVQSSAVYSDMYVAVSREKMQTLIEEHLRNKNRHFANLELHDIVHHDTRTGISYRMFSMDHMTHDGAVLSENCLYLAAFVNGRVDGIVSGRRPTSAGFYPNLADFNGTIVLWSSRETLNADGTLSPEPSTPNEITTYHITCDDGHEYFWNTNGYPYYLIFDKGQKPVKIVPTDYRGSDLETVSFEEDELTVTNVNTISEVSGWDVFLNMNANNGEILSITSYPVEQGSDIVLPFAVYPDMDSSFEGREALYDAIQTSKEMNVADWNKLRLIGVNNYNGTEYAVIAYFKKGDVLTEWGMLLECKTNSDGTVEILSYNEGSLGDSLGNYGYSMNYALLNGKSLCWTTFGNERWATTKDGKETDTSKTVPVDYTGFRFIWPDLHQEDYPAEGNFFLAEINNVRPPAITIPMVGNKALTALGFEA